MSGEVEAAWIAAKATIVAARIQGKWTLAAGVVAVLGGFLALVGAVVAAERQVRLEERRHKARVSAYRFRIETTLAALDRASTIHLGDAKLRVWRANKRIKGDPHTHRAEEMFRYPDAEELSEIHWEDHALLGVEVVRAIYNLRVLLSKYDDFRNDVSARKLDGGDVAPWPHGRRKGDADIIFNADGSVDAPQTNVIETNEILAGEIRRSVEKFGVALKWDKPAEEVQ